MGKNKNRDRSRNSAGDAAERGRRDAERGSVETPEQQMQPQGSPRDVARKHQRRFGHN